MKSLKLFLAIYIHYMKNPLSSKSLLDITLAEAAKDKATVKSNGSSLSRPTHGVVVYKLKTHFDFRGSVTELFDPRWNFHPDPVVFSYVFTIKPNVVKGWSLHKRHEDRYALIKGTMELVLFDPRPDSPTCGEVYRIVLSEKDPCIINVPVNVWHADFNIGDNEAIVVNYPTIQYDHSSPDKWRLPINTPLIPYTFPTGCIGG